MARLTVADLAGVVYSCGKVFDGLSTGRARHRELPAFGKVLTEFYRVADLALLEDLRDAAQFVIDHAESSTIGAAYVRAVNAERSPAAARCTLASCGHRGSPLG